MTYQYPVKNIIPDYWRAGIGVLIAGVPATFAVGSPLGLAILLPLVALFLGFGIQTAVRQYTRVTVDDDHIATTPWGGCIPWPRVERLKLAYYSTRRDSEDGWMQLTLRGDGKRIDIDSRLDGFEAVAARAAVAARRNRVELDPTTLSNYETLGVTVQAEDGE